jgi:hypothetical protein
MDGDPTAIAIANAVLGTPHAGDLVATMHAWFAVETDGVIKDGDRTLRLHTILEEIDNLDPTLGALVDDD